MKIRPLDSLMSDATIWSITLESPITILDEFDECKMFILQATEELYHHICNSINDTLTYDSGKESLMKGRAQCS